MIYPAVIVCLLIAVVFVMMIVVVPKMTDFLRKLAKSFLADTDSSRGKLSRRTDSYARSGLGIFFGRERLENRCWKVSVGYVYVTSSDVWCLL
jgi:hypothetical protein